MEDLITINWSISEEANETTPASASSANPAGDMINASGKSRQ